MTIERVIQALRVDGEVVEGVRFGGTRFSAAIRLDRQEVGRRRDVGLAAVLEPRLLEAMSSLPLGIEVPLPGIDPLLVAVLDSAPAGVIEIGDDYLRRLLKPVVDVELVIVESKMGSFPLAAAAGFAADAPRSIVMPEPPSDLWLLREAEAYGVGVVVDTASPNVLVVPSFERRGKPSPRHWWFLETVYDRWIANTAPASTHPTR